MYFYIFLIPATAAASYIVEHIAFSSAIGNQPPSLTFPSRPPNVE